jgi:hypothetical protein
MEIAGFYKVNLEKSAYWPFFYFDFEKKFFKKKFQNFYKEKIAVR